MTTNPLSVRSGFLLRQIAVADSRNLSRMLAPMNLRPVEAVVLQIVAANPNVTQATVGRMIGIAAPNMCPLITKLSERGLIRRLPRGRRTVGLLLTGNGQSLVRKVSKVTEHHDAAFLARVPASHRRSFVAALRVLSNMEPAGARRS